MWEFAAMGFRWPMMLLMLVFIDVERNVVQ